ncbi:MAG TPA: ABC transporter ATP-binding protein [Candidatus Sulfotelmatobacter sp.]|nr:ABC transporter ATP-binding protein [Candidatus Sulfotelmatobacter sp.]
MLRLEGVRAAYGRVEALRGVTLEVRAGELVTLIGANGAGKTTTLKTISGILRPTAGHILFEGEAIHGLSPRGVLRRGIAHCPEGRRIFPYMSVLENLEMGAYARADAAGVREDLDRVLARFPALAERLRQVAGTLSGGEQQMLAIGRALMARPRVLLLDEPSLGLAPAIIETTFEIIREIRRRGVTVLMVEQNASLALRMADRGYVLESGQVAVAGTGADLIANDHVRRAYLGG